MKKIINGRKYDTKTATFLAGYDDNLGWRDFDHVEMYLYRKNKGDIFLHIEADKKLELAYKEKVEKYLKYLESLEKAETELDYEEKSHPQEMEKKNISEEKSDNARVKYTFCDNSKESIEARVVGLYGQNISMKEIARMEKISPMKVRKILIHAGAWESKRSRDIAEMVQKGLTLEEIAERYRMTTKTISAYLPYTKVIYKGDHPTKNALGIRKYRMKKKTEKESQ